jgi:hypothetical protein
MAALETYAIQQQQAPPVNDVLKLGKAGVQYLFPETYQAATSWMPSVGDIAGSLGLEGFGSTALGQAAGGAMAAASYAAPAMALFKIISFLEQSQRDRSIELAAGDSQNLGDFNLQSTMRPEDGARLQSLYDNFIGDRGWYAGGDPSKVGDLDSHYGIFSIQEERPYFDVGSRVAYEYPELAIASGRNLARTRMGLPVEYDDLSGYMTPGDPRAIAAAQRDRSLPVYDGEIPLPANWDEVLSYAAQNYGSGEGQSGPHPGWGALINGSGGPMTRDDGGYDIPSGIQAMPELAEYQNPRLQEWLNLGLNRDQIYAYTGQNSPDYDPGLMGQADAAASPSTPALAAIASLINPAPFDPLNYGAGPQRRFFPDR